MAITTDSITCTGGGTSVHDANGYNISLPLQVAHFDVVDCVPLASRGTYSVGPVVDSITVHQNAKFYAEVGGMIKTPLILAGANSTLALPYPSEGISLVVAAPDVTVKEYGLYNRYTFFIGANIKVPSTSYRNSLILNTNPNGNSGMDLYCPTGSSGDNLRLHGTIRLEADVNIIDKNGNYVVKAGVRV